MPRATVFNVRALQDAVKAMDPGTEFFARDVAECAGMSPMQTAMILRTKCEKWVRETTRREAGAHVWRRI